ncbi:acylneuraminate cytidylyltransferase family protein [Dyadobacter aurulentus]|uniref:acylneuraminate cytidylyltransferase family protein n=1 Tax=Dyadobacter sp. UC 10 TaxID=2605428 RepID=UPI0011F2696A|nr:acylneuraminate cytidylyltransferase family protein [Dyadobacter sp. UC 10]KAA0990028.1 acylneuraminate cytidylyltransferase family protein [Dyadobacter sp. UC 10]
MKAQPRILGIIPAREGSKGIYNKNMKLLGGKPLIYYTIESALRSKLLTTCIVSSDCLRILEYSRQFPTIEVPFVRPKNLASDFATSIEVVSHAVNHYLERSIKFDYVVLLQPTSPFRSRDLIDKSIHLMLESGADSLVTVQKIPDKFHPNWAFFLGQEGLQKAIYNTERIIPRRQDLADSYYRDGKIYIAKTTLIMEGKLLGGKIASLVAEGEPDINIDSYADWEMAQKQIYKWKQCQNESYWF